MTSGILVQTAENVDEDVECRDAAAWAGRNVMAGRGGTQAGNSQPPGGRQVLGLSSRV